MESYEIMISFSFIAKKIKQQCEIKKNHEFIREGRSTKH